MGIFNNKINFLLGKKAIWFRGKPTGGRRIKLFIINK
jgi:hypothetical protein